MSRTADDAALARRAADGDKGGVQTGCNSKHAYHNS